MNEHLRYFEKKQNIEYVTRVKAITEKQAIDLALDHPILPPSYDINPLEHWKIKKIPTQFTENDIISVTNNLVDNYYELRVKLEIDYYKYDYENRNMSKVIPYSFNKDILDQKVLDDNLRNSMWVISSKDRIINNNGAWLSIKTTIVYLPSGQLLNDEQIEEVKFWIKKQAEELFDSRGGTIVLNVTDREDLVDIVSNYGHYINWDSYEAENLNLDVWLEKFKFDNSSYHYKEPLPKHHHWTSDLKKDKKSNE